MYLRLTVCLLSERMSDWFFLPSSIAHYWLAQRQTRSWYSLTLQPRLPVCPCNLLFNSHVWISVSISLRMFNCLIINICQPCLSIWEVCLFSVGVFVFLHDENTLYSSCIFVLLTEINHYLVICTRAYMHRWLHYFYPVLNNSWTGIRQSVMFEVAWYVC